MAVLNPVDRDGTSFDCDAAFSFNVQVIKNLFAKLALRDRTALQQQLVGERTLAMVDMGYNTEITDELRVHSCTNKRSKGMRGLK